VRPLLAKSYDTNINPHCPPRYALLTQHSRDVAAACSALVETIGLQCLENANLPDKMLDELNRAVKLNGWIQDVGKANSHFQDMLAGTEDVQMIRHEVVSAILFWTRPELKALLSELPATTRLASIWGALGHHRKFEKYYSPNDQRREMKVFLTHPDFEMILAELAQSLALPGPQKFTEDLCISSDNATSIVRRLKDDFADLEDEFKTSEQRRFLALVKSIGISADVCASAIAFEQSREAVVTSIADVIEQQLGTTGLTEADFSVIIKSRLAKVADQSSPDPRTAFQKRVAESAATLTLVEAGCGSGKSIAAYQWGAEWCRKANDNGRKNFRFFFCLPTTGTTTEHFKDYALESGIDPTLLCLTHSRATIDLQTLAETVAEEDIDTEREVNRRSLAEACLKARRDKIESLALWSTPLVVTTADTVLGLMVNARRAIYSLPAIMNAAIVFDECHAFDHQMFPLLLAFIKNFPNIPILLMTASLSSVRRDALIEARPDLQIVPGPREFEDQPRYLVSPKPVQSSELFARVKSCFEEGGKILWVRNQVQWANAKYQELLNEFPSTANIDVYHSRLKYKHRSIRHRRVIDQFKEESTGCILVATQVAEMSLDLSADLLITDMAPIPALIQRMGRLNRKAKPKQVIQPNLIVVPLPDNDVAPYEPAELHDAETWINELNKRNAPLSQNHLSAQFEVTGKGHSYSLASAEKEAIFFSGLWQTRPGLTRKAGYTINVILQEDLKTCPKLNKFGNPEANWIRNHEVAIPIKAEMSTWERIGHIPVAPPDRVTYQYNEQTNIGTGAEWK